MSKLPVIRSPQSDRDLQDIWSYIAKDSVTAASAMLRKIDRKIEMLATHPHLGERLTQFGPHVRRIIVGNYLVFYQALDDCIRVMRVHHAARRWEDLL